MPPRFRIDELNRTLLFTGGGLLLLTWLLGFVPGASSAAWEWAIFALRIPALFCATWALFRMFSKNSPARAAENQGFLVFQVKLRDFFRGSGKNHNTAKGNWHPSQWKKIWEEARQYRRLSCPQCTQKLRVPRGKGKIRVTCSKCGNKFIVKS